MESSNDNNKKRFSADFLLDFRNINFIPYRFRPSAKVRPKRDIRGKGIKT